MPYLQLLFLSLIAIVTLVKPALPSDKQTSDNKHSVEYALTPDSLMKIVSRQLGDTIYWKLADYNGYKADTLKEVINQLSSRGYLKNTEIFVLKSKSWNAFASAGLSEPDLICLYTNLIEDVQTKDELATVLSHEISHNNRKHGSAKARAFGLSILISALALKNAPMEQHKAFINLMNNGYTRDQEMTADADAVVILTKTGYNPNSAFELWERVSKKDSVDIGRSFMDHPPSRDRADSLRAFVNRYVVKKKDVYRIDSSYFHRDTSFTIQQRYTNGCGAAGAAFAFNLFFEASKYDFDVSKLKWKKMEKTSYRWLLAGFSFGFILPSDFSYTSSDKPRAKTKKQSSISITPVVEPFSDAFKLNFRVTF
ncbi:MAG: M48 family metallopeptidase [bacterium]|nr:M48 family metallopeptidase [bacterium]